MKVAIGCDHHGVALKDELVQELTAAGHELFDVGTDSDTSVDYPDIAGSVSRRVRDGQSERGILICGSGIGMSIAANKHDGIRAAVCTDAETAELCRRHNDTNVVCLSGKSVAPNVNKQIVKTWIESPFDGGRHQRRVDKVTEIENGA